MKETIKNSGIAEELMSVIFNPKNMNKWNDWGLIFRTSGNVRIY
jgi:hypothetical protein